MKKHWPVKGVGRAGQARRTLLSWFTVGDLVFFEPKAEELGGAIWRVVTVGTSRLHIEPAFKLNGPDDLSDCYVKPRAVDPWTCRKADMVRLGLEFQRFRQFIMDEVERRSGEET